MKRLAECVPGREIRAGARRLRTRARGFTIKSSSSEQVSRFLQDGRRTELRLTVIRTSDRTKIAHLANLYSLSLGYEAPCQVSPFDWMLRVAMTDCTTIHLRTFLIWANEFLEMKLRYGYHFFLFVHFLKKKVATTALSINKQALRSNYQTFSCLLNPKARWNETHFDEYYEGILAIQF